MQDRRGYSAKAIKVCSTINYLSHSHLLMEERRQRYPGRGYQHEPPDEQNQHNQQPDHFAFPHEHLLFQWQAIKKETSTRWISLIYQAISQVTFYALQETLYATRNS